MPETYSKPSVFSQEEQFYINGQLPDFHQLEVPDVWIGLSGELSVEIVHVNLSNQWKYTLNTRRESIVCVVSSDKDQDGNFQWVDKTHLEFSNWRANFPQNTANMWDCGQIYTGEEENNLIYSYEHLHVFLTFLDITLDITLFCSVPFVQETTMANGRPPTAIKD